MNASNFTPIAGKDSPKKKSSSKLKIFSLISLFVMIVGVGVSYVMVRQGFIFQPKAASRGGSLIKYGWNGSCFTRFSKGTYGAYTITNTVDHARRYQCPGKITTYAASGCQKSNGSRTGVWDYNKIPLHINGVSQVCLDPSGNSGPKDSNGCFTQQLDLEDNQAPGPEAFYSYDDCTPTNPKPPASSPTPIPTQPPESTPTPTQPPESTPTPTPPPGSTPTPTPPYCVNPGTPANVHINCPLCDQANN